MIDTSKIDHDELLEAVRESQFGMGSTGFCLACGEPTEGVEPDATNYPCPCCGKRQVYGAEEILLYIAY